MWMLSWAVVPWKPSDTMTCPISINLAAFSYTYDWCRLLLEKIAYTLRAKLIHMPKAPSANSVGDGWWYLQ